MFALDNGFHINTIQKTDKSAFIEHFREREIYERTLSIPFPYTEADADFWIEHVAARAQQNGQPVEFAIRNQEGKLIGAVGFDRLVVGKSHLAEIGYWLAKPYWGSGIMTAAVGKICGHAFSKFGIVRITAHIFAFNTGSQRVLEKNGFVQEGYLTKHYLKDGKYQDGKLFALVR